MLKGIFEPAGELLKHRPWIAWLFLVGFIAWLVTRALVTWTQNVRSDFAEEKELRKQLEAKVVDLELEAVALRGLLNNLVPAMSNSSVPTVVFSAQGEMVIANRAADNAFYRPYGKLASRELGRTFRESWGDSLGTVFERKHFRTVRRGRLAYEVWRDEEGIRDHGGYFAVYEPLRAMTTDRLDAISQRYYPLDDVIAAFREDGYTVSRD